MPDLPRSGEAQHPRHTPYYFHHAYGGFLVDGKLYREVSWNGTNFEVVLEDGVEQQSFAPGTDAPTGEIRPTSPVVATTQGAYDVPLPSKEARCAFMYVSADADAGSGPFAGSIYAAWTDNVKADSDTPSESHGRIRVARSRDNGATWQVSSPLKATDQLTVDRFHP